MKIRAIISIAVLSCLMAGAGLRAQDSPLKALDSWGLGHGWEGVGLLNIEGRSTCTGVMIRSDLVLTAAHCLYDIKTGERVDPRRVEFRAGWRDGKAIARRMGKAAVVHEKFPDSPKLSARQIRNDVAVLQLADPILSTHALPFKANGSVKEGNQVSVVSFGAGRNNVASRQRACDVLEANDGVLAMSCDVVPGSSGAPVFAQRQGRQEIVSLVSSLGFIDGKPMSFGMDLQKPLADVLNDLKTGRGVFPKVSTGAKRITVGGGGQRTGGALFLKP